MANPITPECIASVQNRFWDKVIIKGPNECWEWAGNRDIEGYGRIKIQGKLRRAIRYAVALSGREVRTSDVICHKCDNPACVNPRHLLAAAQSKNIADRLERTGPQYKGGAPTLCPDDVLAIRASDDNRNNLARKYGVKPSTISDVRNRRTWRNL